MKAIAAPGTIIIVLFSLQAAVLAQAPGGVDVGLRIWLRADSIPDADGISIAEWFDAAGPGRASQTTAQFQPMLETSVVNGHPVVRFDGVDDFLVLDSDMISSSSAGIEVFFVAHGNPRGGLVLGNAGPDGSLVRFGDDGGALVGSDSLQMNDSLLAVPALFHYKRFRDHLLGQINASPWDSVLAGEWTSTAEPMALGRAGDTAAAYFSGDLAEIIVFDRELTTAEAEQVQTYLGAKFGITLAQQYIASDGGQYWSQHAHAIHGYHVGVIGRDDGSGFYQTRARSIVAGSVLSMEHIAALSNHDFWAWGSSDSALVEVDEMINGVQTRRLKRSWHAHRRRNAGRVNMSFDLTGVGRTGTTPADYWLVLALDDTLVNGIRSIHPADVLEGDRIVFNNVGLEADDYLYLVTSNPDGAVLNVALEEDAALPKASFDLIFPNPFQGQVTAQFVLASEGQVLLQVYDVNGRRVDTLLDDWMPAGRHQVRHDGSTLASGFYYYRLTTGGRTQSRSAALVR